jgi:hypothetical protein
VSGDVPIVLGSVPVVGPVSDLAHSDLVVSVVPCNVGLVLGVSPVDDSSVSVGSLLGGSEASSASGVSGVALSLGELLGGLLE